VRILLIDDEDMVRDLFRSILIDAGYEVVIVNKMGKVAIIPYHAIVSVMTTN